MKQDVQIKILPLCTCEYGQCHIFTRQFFIWLRFESSSQKLCELWNRLEYPEQKATDKPPQNGIFLPTFGSRAVRCCWLFLVTVESVPSCSAKTRMVLAFRIWPVLFIKDIVPFLTSLGKQLTLLPPFKQTQTLTTIASCSVPSLTGSSPHRHPGAFCCCF